MDSQASSTNAAGGEDPQPPPLIPQLLPSGLDQVDMLGAEGVPTAAPSSELVRQPKRTPHDAVRSRNPGDLLLHGLSTASAWAILGIGLTMIGVLVVQSRDALTHFGLGFITGSTWDVTNEVFGAVPAIAGTVYCSVLALILAAPTALLIAVFLSEMAPRRIRGPLGFLVELLAAIPSIVYGFWALFVLVPIMSSYVDPFLTAHLGWMPLFAVQTPTGLGVLTAALILSVMILPTIAAISRDVLIAVPRSQREAMLALGATRWEATWKVVIPYARSGIIGGMVLGLGRAVGETMAVTMVIGNSVTTGWSMLTAGTTIPAMIVNQFADAGGGLYRQAVLELALILLVITVALNAIARLLVWSVTRTYAA